MTRIFGRLTSNRKAALRIFAFWGDEEEGMAKMRSGFAPDVLFPCNYSIKKWVDSGLLQPVDFSRLSHWDDIIPAPEKFQVAPSAATITVFR